MNLSGQRVTTSMGRNIANRLWSVWDDRRNIVTIFNASLFYTAWVEVRCIYTEYQDYSVGLHGPSTRLLWLIDWLIDWLMMWMLVWLWNNTSHRSVIPPDSCVLCITRPVFYMISHDISFDYWSWNDKLSNACHGKAYLRSAVEHYVVEF